MPADVEVPPNLWLIGGEMLVWSDESAGAGPPPASGRLLEMLAASACAGAGRVLVAGPHRAELIGRLATPPAALTCLLRSYADGAAMAMRFPGARILCGSLAKLGLDEQFDAIVALDSAQRLNSTDGADMSWAESLELLLAALRPGGRLVLALDNPLGIHRLVALAPGPDEDPDSAWPPVEHDRTRPRSLVGLAERLTTAGLEVRESYFGYAQPAAPGVLIAAAGTAVADTELYGYLDGTVAAAAGEAFSGVPVLADPRQLAVSALRGGAGAHLAPLWLVVADRPAEDGEPDGAPSPRIDLPEVLVADAGADAEQRRGWSVAYAVEPEGGVWTRRLVEARDPRVRAAGPVRRDPARLAGSLPAGRCLEDLLLTACLRRDVPRLRELLADYAMWLAGLCDAAELLPAEYGFATPRNTVLDGSTFAVLDPSWSLADPVEFEVGLLRGLRQFAVTIVTGGYPHPWPAAVDADALTVILAGMAGSPTDRAAVRRAVDLEVEITAAVRGLDERRRAELAGRLAEASAGTPPVDLDSHRALHTCVQWLQRCLSHAEAKLAWYEEVLAARERSLHQAQRRVTMLTGSLSFRVGRLLIAPARIVKREVTRALRRWRVARR
jgi:hypothetical protein